MSARKHTRITFSLNGEEAGEMDAHCSCKQETDALIEAIWGPNAAEVPAPVDPTFRARQNDALAAAIKAYLQLYLAESHSIVPGPDELPKYIG